MRRKLAAAAMFTLVLTTACGKAGDSTDDQSTDTFEGRTISFDGVSQEYMGASSGVPTDAEGYAHVPYTMKLTLGDVQKLDPGFTMKDYGGRDTVKLGQADCITPDIDDIIPFTLTPTYKDKATAKVELAAEAHFEAEDAYDNDVNESHPQGIGVVWLNSQQTNCALSMDGTLGRDSAVTNGYNLTGVIILHGGRDNYKGWKLKLKGGIANKVTNITGDKAKPTYGGVEFPLLP